MFTEYWLRFAVVMVILAVMLQSNALIVLAVMLLTTIPVAWAWNRVSLWRVTYDRALSERRVFMGETVDLTLRVSNRKILPLSWITIDDRFPEAILPINKPLEPSRILRTANLTQRATLGGFERARWDYQIKCDRRGFYTLGPARIRSGDLFGLFESARTSPRTDHLIVYPRITPMEEWGLPPKDPLGDVKARLPIFDDATRPRSVRDYRPDDALKHIHWRATARRNQLQVKVYDPTINYQWILFVNVATFAHWWEGVYPELLEQVISLAASIANFAVEHKYAVGLIANGTWPESDQRLKISPSRDPNHLRHLLEALAAISFGTMPIEKLLHQESAGLPWGAALIMITGIVTDEILAEMLRLHEAGRRLALISLDEVWIPEEARLDGIIVRRAQSQEQRIKNPNSHS